MTNAISQFAQISDPMVTEYNLDYKAKGSLQGYMGKKLDQLRLAIFLIPGNRDEIYNEIKSVAELNMGLVTQCLNQDQRYWDMSLSQQLITNFLLKINPKCAGINGALDQSVKPPLLKNRLMIIGLGKRALNRRLSTSFLKSF